MENIKLKRLEFLNEMIEYYSVDPINRRCTDGFMCRYSPETLELTESEGCAIGRKLPREIANMIDSEGTCSITSIFSNTRLEKLLPEELKYLGCDFLRAIQVLHDVGYNWDKNGLTEKGKKEVENIKLDFCNMTLSEKRLAFLQETVDYYSVDPLKRRCKTTDGCCYSPESLNLSESEGCAIGRKLPRGLANYIDKEIGSIGINWLVGDQIERFPKELTELGIDFLSKIQGLHDIDQYWCEEGLTGLGLREVNMIKLTYCI